MFEKARSLLPGALLSVATVVLSAACAQEAPDDEDSIGQTASELTGPQRSVKYEQIRTAARAHGVDGTAYLFAGIAYSETGLAHCWSEATWACQGPASPDCGGGPVIAGAGDGPCSIREGGLGMFQFDSGTFTDTLNRYGNRVLVMDGQLEHAVDYVVNMVKISVYTTDAETDAKALAWINRFDPNNGTLRDQWVKTVTRYYNGCQPSWSCWSQRYSHYNAGLTQVLNDTGGTGYWRQGGSGNSGGSVTCAGGSGTVIGAIADKYRLLGACTSPLGRPVTSELPTADGVGRYNHFENGSIYWTPKLGAFAVVGAIREKWKALGWEQQFAGYPISDELKTPDGVGRYSVFQGASIYWTPRTGAHEVHGTIRDKYKELGWEGGVLGYPTSDEYAIPGGRRNDFEGGSILWDARTNTAWIAEERAAAN